MTHDSKFTTSTKVEKEVPMMSQRGNIASYTTDDESAIVMPMSNGRLEALFIMPNKTDIYNYVSSITASKIDRMYNEAKVGDIQISLPKVEMKMHYDLKNILQKMGITDPFNERAKFETMGTASGKILLTRAIHDVFMKVDEKGMEGAAVTTIGVGTTSMPPSIYFDRPYMMVVRDRATGTYLFMGKIEDPTK
jgi:serine protease inhibitor